MKKALMWMLVAAGGVAYWLRKLQQEEANQVFLKDKVVLITGGASPIGRAAARAFAGQGAKLALLDIKTEALAPVKEELAVYEVPVLTIAADVLEADEINSAINAVLSEYGRIDVLVNNAGVDSSGGFETLSIDEMRKVLDVNLFGVMLMTRLVLPHMLKTGSGAVVNVSGIAARLHIPEKGAYAASKTGVVGLTNALRREFMSRGVHFASVLPGEAVDNPALIGGEIVNAVRFKRVEVVAGGWQAQFKARLAEYPELLDSFYAQGGEVMK